MEPGVLQNPFLADQGGQAIPQLGEGLGAPPEVRSRLGRGSPPYTEPGPKVVPPSGAGRFHFGRAVNYHPVSGPGRLTLQGTAHVASDHLVEVMEGMIIAP